MILTFLILILIFTLLRNEYAESKNDDGDDDDDDDDDEDDDDDDGNDPSYATLFRLKRLRLNFGR